MVHWDEVKNVPVYHAFNDAMEMSSLYSGTIKVEDTIIRFGAHLSGTDGHQVNLSDHNNEKSSYKPRKDVTIASVSVKL